MSDIEIDENRLELLEERVVMSDGDIVWVDDDEEAEDP